MTGPSDLFKSSVTWKSMLADPKGPVADADLHFDLTGPSPWRQNRQARKSMEEEWSKSFPPSKYGHQAEIVQVPMRDGAVIQVKVYRPIPTGSSTSSKPRYLPLVFNTHGGGWYQGSTHTEEIFLLRAIMDKFDFIIVSPEYRLAPEHPFPTPLDDCWDTLLWTLRNEDKLGFDPAQVLLAASSAGASLTAAIGVRVGDILAGQAGATFQHLGGGDNGGDNGGGDIAWGSKVRVKGVFLNVPITCHPDFLPPNDKYPNTSYAEATSGTTLLCAEEMREIWKLYVATEGPNSGANPEASPLLADLRNFPRARIYIAGQDPVRDEAVAFVTKLREAGRDVEVVMYPGVPHVFGAFDDLMEAKQFWKDCEAGIKALMS